MVETPPTRSTRQSPTGHETGADAWREFVRIHGPVIYGFARKRGLPDAAAADLVEAVLRGAATGAGTGEYDPGRGTTGGMLYAVTRDRIRDALAAGTKRPRGTGDDDSRAASAPEYRTEPDPDWDIGYQRAVAGAALDRVKTGSPSSTWRAFWMTAVDGRLARDVGLELGMSPGEVYLARCRVLARLREEVRRLERHRVPTGSY